MHVRGLNDVMLLQEESEGEGIERNSLPLSAAVTDGRTADPCLWRVLVWESSDVSNQSVVHNALFASIHDSSMRSANAMQS